MNAFSLAISQIFKGALKAFKTFPAVIGCALAFSLVTIIRIHLEWPEQEAYNFLFNSLHWAFAFGSIFSLMAITAAQSRYESGKAFLYANVLGILATAIVFILLYTLSGAPDFSGSRYHMISELAQARVVVGMLISFLAFIYLAGFPKEESSVSASFFMTHKAFFIAAIYGAVLMGGTSAVAGAVKALLYDEMSTKVYMYIGTLVGFTAFSIFIGYFPDFRKGQLDERREAVQKQPRFVQILFEFILVPILFAMSVVLVLWVGRALVTGVWPTFSELSGIVTSFTIGGIWLHMMVTDYQSWLPKAYKRIYPIVLLVILAFAAWALWIQLGKSGLKLEEYAFALTWVFALKSAILLIWKKEKAHSKILLIVCVLAFIAVLPIIGLQELPVSAQLNRLERALVSQDMFVNEQIVPTQKELDRSVRETITDAVDYLSYQYQAELPSWFDRGLSENQVFKKTFGFEQARSEPEYPSNGGGGDYLSTSLVLPVSVLDISTYDWMINLQDENGKINQSAVVEGKNGRYELEWLNQNQRGIPTFKVLMDGAVILETDLSAFIDRISETYKPTQGGPITGTIEDMSYTLESPEVSVVLVFSNIEISLNTREDIINYWFNLRAVYVNEKP